MSRSYSYSTHSSSVGRSSTNPATSYNDYSTGQSSFPGSTLEKAERAMANMRSEVPSLFNNNSNEYVWSDSSQLPEKSDTSMASQRSVMHTTTTAPNPYAAVAMQSLEREFNRIGRLPDDYEDDFEKIKQQIQSGEAYRNDDKTDSPVKTEMKRTTFTLPSINRNSENLNHSSIKTEMARQNFTSPPTNRNTNSSTITRTSFTKEYTPTSPPQKSTENLIHNTSLTSEPTMYKSELFIPIKRHHDTFDNFHMSRWADLTGSSALMDADFERRRTDWERRLDHLKQDFFKFSPFHEMPSHHAIEPSKHVMSNPSGKPEFNVQFDVKDFKPEEINLSTKDGRLVISAVHEERSGGSTSRREFKRTLDLPQDVQVGLMRSVLSKDGILSVTAPIKPPTYAITSPGHITQQHAVQTSSSSSANRGTVATPQALNYSMSVVGYKPEDINVTVEGRKVKVQAKHDESSTTRKVHNEMTKTFDLPAGVDPYQVHSFIRDGHTLHIEAHLHDNLGGKIHILPVNHKY